MPRKKKETVVTETPVTAEVTEEVIKETPVIEEPVEVKEAPKAKTKKKVEELPEFSNGEIILCQYVRVRSSAKIAEENIIGTIPVGTKVLIHNKMSRGDFLYIQTANNIYGFVVKDYVKVK